MGLFVEQQPGKKVDLTESDWVQLQPLSRGYIVVERQKILEIAKGTKIHVKVGGAFDMDTSNIDPALLNKIQEIEYEKVKASIKEWSEKEPVTVENIKRLPDAFYNKILKAIDELNSVSDTEVKN